MELKPGRELDALISRNVMKIENAFASCPHCNGQISEGLFYPGIGCHNCKWQAPYESGVMLVKNYSTDLIKAWEVVEHVRTHFKEAFSLHSPCDDTKQWHAKFERKWHGRDFSWGGETADTAAHAICLAALTAVGYTK